MPKKILALIVIGVVVFLGVTVVVVVQQEPKAVRPAPTVGSIRDLKPVALPSTAPETQPPKDAQDPKGQ